MTCAEERAFGSGPRTLPVSALELLRSAASLRLAGETGSILFSSAFSCGGRRSIASSSLASRPSLLSVRSASSLLDEAEIKGVPRSISSATSPNEKMSIALSARTSAPVSMALATSGDE